MRGPQAPPFQSRPSNAATKVANAVEVIEHLAIPETQDTNTVLEQNGGATCVFRYGVRLGVLAAVEFGGQPVFSAEEVQNEARHGNLPSPFVAIQPPVAQAAPEQAFGVCLALS